ncbi:TPA: hypothetical protein CPT98_02345 [Candidatus Gastranaerophilales bacterium HUM_19]|mgnify:FL=1|nr:MAG TPA: hypothetical protein CPT97_11180 [Candidatus Gastranaerophilales bacterium HUM_17]DAB18937.1 MAG TPA: hypothetical protein CPT98_02345 [Candidatus Gastranaerophilales bacterium HUM_19]DAB26644.1 MAG TPA: hypothetical protein CPT86_02480 [Candidatus Gastranaerophilales bacterium HUM_23]
MQVSPIKDLNFGNNKILSKSTCKIKRELLQKTSCLKNINGPEEVKEARGWVAYYTAANTGIGALSAQAPGADELALAGIEVAMATTIFNGVYYFDFSKTVIKNLLVGIIGNRVGTYAFKGASKLVTWIPGIGNCINAAVAGSTTAALGASIIAMCEDMDKARKRGEALDRFIKKMDEE